MAERKRILTGDRTTGKLHLGHYIGSHRHRLAFQDEYECFFLLADLHMLTTKPDKESILQSADNGRTIVMDHLAIGIDPAKVTFCLQSAIHETYELQLLISSLVTVERLQQLPTIKDMANAAGFEQLPYNLLGYPVLQSADIMLPRAHLVPVGKDNESHVEITRQIARRFNNAYGEAGGDQVIKAVAGGFRQVLRDADIAARLAGDEFAFVLPDTTLEEALQISERLRISVSRLEIPIVVNVPEGRVMEQQLSIKTCLGVAVSPQHGSTGPALLAAADAALRKAKDQGRNRVIAAG